MQFNLTKLLLNPISLAWHFTLAKIIGETIRNNTSKYLSFFIANCNRVNSETNCDGVALQMTKQLNSRTIFFEVAEYYREDSRFGIGRQRAAQPT